MPRKKRELVTWVTMGPEPHLATCHRCGQTIPKPPLPLSIQKFVAYMRATEGAHSECLEAPS